MVTSRRKEVMRKQIAKKLRLAAETIKQLDKNELAQVVGGSQLNNTLGYGASCVRSCQTTTE